jgi:dihydroxyacetone kinase
VPILNGLGSVKYEELFVVYRRVAEVLEAAGVSVVDPHVGEFCTSFDMAGTSLTLFWLDDELERLWHTPVDAPAYRRGTVEPAARILDTEPAKDDDAREVPAADEASRAAAARVHGALEVIAKVVDDNVDELGRIDAVAGDGDHGIGMQRGAHAAFAAATVARDAGAGAGTLLARAADAWADKAGGTSGALWGVILRAVAGRLGDSGAPVAEAVAAGVADGCRGVMEYGKAEPGDKTLVDALVPFSAELTRGVERGDDLATSWAAAATASESAAQATSQLRPRLGRARTHGMNSVGTPDPGAISLSLIARAIAQLLASTPSERTSS